MMTGTSPMSPNYQGATESTTEQEPDINETLDDQQQELDEQRAELERQKQDIEELKTQVKHLEESRMAR